MATRSSRCSRSYQRLNSASSDGSMSIDVSSIPFPASGISDVLSRDLGGHVRDRLHYSVVDAAIVRRMSAPLAATKLGFREDLRERMPRRVGTSEVIAALQHDPGNPIERSG